MSTDRDHRVAVLVLDGAKALDVGIAAHVFAKRPSMPYEVRVCAEHADLADDAFVAQGLSRWLA